MESTMCKAERKSAKKWIMLCQPAGWNRVQKHSWGKPHERKKKSQVPLLMFTKWMLMNLDAVLKKAANKGTKSILQPADTIQWVPTSWFICRYLFSKEMKNLEGKAAVDKEWCNLTDVPA